MVSKEEIIDLKKKNFSQREISKVLSCSEGYVSRIVKDFGLSYNIDSKFIGNRFGKITPIKRIGSDKNGHAKYFCVCECGNSFETIGNALETGNTSSCGCTSRKTGKLHKNWSGYEEISSGYFSRIRKGAIDRNFEFNISIKDIWDKFIEQDRRCKLSGVLLMMAPTGKTKKLQTASLDRINSKIGYDIDNVQWIHKHLNVMKWHLFNDDFINWCHAVSDYNRKNEIDNELQ